MQVIVFFFQSIIIKFKKKPFPVNCHQRVKTSFYSLDHDILFKVKPQVQLHILKNVKSKHFYFLLPMHGRESIDLNSNFRNWDFMLYECVHVCACVYAINITQKDIIWIPLNLIFYVCVLHSCYLQFFYEDQTNSLCIVAHNRIRIHYSL